MSTTIRQTDEQPLLFDSEEPGLPCPHCNASVALPDPKWLPFPPYTCSSCGQLWGLGYRGTFPVRKQSKPIWPLMTWQQAINWQAHYEHDGYYVYAICYPNGLPFYVGKGKGARLVQHAAWLRKHPNLYELPEQSTEKESVLRDIAMCNQQERYAILAICESEALAYRIEAVATRLWGQRENRTGALCNITLAVRIPRDLEMPTPPEMLHVQPDPNYAPARTPIRSGMNSHVRSNHFIWCKHCDGKVIWNREFLKTDLRCPWCLHFLEAIEEHRLLNWLPAELLKYHYESDEGILDKHIEEWPAFPEYPQRDFNPRRDPHIGTTLSDHSPVTPIERSMLVEYQVKAAIAANRATMLEKEKAAVEESLQYEQAHLISFQAEMQREMEQLRMHFANQRADAIEQVRAGSAAEIDSLRHALQVARDEAQTTRKMSADLHPRYMEAMRRIDYLRKTRIDWRAVPVAGIAGIVLGLALASTVWALLLR